MDLHRLRVVGFDTLVSEKEGEKKNIAEHEQYKQADYYDVSSDAKKVETNELGIDTKCPCDNISPPGSSKISSFIKCKSNSEIFRIPSKYKLKKRDLKKNNSSLEDFTKQPKYSTHSDQKKRSLNLFNRKSTVNQCIERKNRKDTKQKGDRKKNEEIHYLFARETPSFIRYSKKHPKNHESKESGESKSPNDIYGFQEHNRSVDSYLYHMSCNYLNIDKCSLKRIKKGFRRKQKAPQPEKESYSKHHVMKVLNSAVANSREHSGNPSMYYNLTTVHSQPRRMHRKRENLRCVESWSRNHPYLMAKDQNVAVTPSSLVSIKKYLCDACVGSGKIEIPLRSNHRPPGPRPSLHKHSCPRPQSRPLHTPSASRPRVAASKKKQIGKMSSVVNSQRNGVITGFLHNVFHTKSRPSGKSCFKYAFFSLLVVVWSPCLLAVILAWIIMCPVRLTHVLANNSLSQSKKSSALMNSFMNRFRKKGPESEYQQMRYDSSSRHNMMSSVVGWYARAAGTVVNSFNAMLSTLKIKNNVASGSSILTAPHPNPKKKYTLFYADNKGWMMKPARYSNSRSCSTRVMRCEFKPKFWQKSKYDEKHEMKNATYECPVHGIHDKNLAFKQARQVLPAGDASVALEHQGPPCICSEIMASYSRNRCCFPKKCAGPNNTPGSTMIVSQCLPAQQVNMLPSQNYQMPGIVSNSAHYQTLYPNSQMYDPSRIAGMTQKRKIKRHPGQLKNGILPFGMVLDCPYGTKHPVIANREAFRIHKIGLAGKTLNMSKYTSNYSVKSAQRRTTKHGKPLECLSELKQKPYSLGNQRSYGSTDIRYHHSDKSKKSDGQYFLKDKSIKCPCENPTKIKKTRLSKYCPSNKTKDKSCPCGSSKTNKRLSGSRKTDFRKLPGTLKTDYTKAPCTRKTDCTKSPCTHKIGRKKSPCTHKTDCTKLPCTRKNNNTKLPFTRKTNHTRSPRIQKTDYQISPDACYIRSPNTRKPVYTKAPGTRKIHVPKSPKIGCTRSPHTHKSDDTSSSNFYCTRPPSMHNSHICYIKSHETCCTRSHETCCTKPHDVCCTKSHDVCCTKSHNVCCTKSHDVCCTKSHDVCCTKSHDICCPKSPRASKTNTLRHICGKKPSHPCKTGGKPHDICCLKSPTARKNNITPSRHICCTKPSCTRKTAATTSSHAYKTKPPCAYKIDATASSHVYKTTSPCDCKTNATISSHVYKKKSPCTCITKATTSSHAYKTESPCSCKTVATKYKTQKSTGQDGVHNRNKYISADLSQSVETNTGIRADKSQNVSKHRLRKRTIGLENRSSIMGPQKLNRKAKNISKASFNQTISSSQRTTSTGRSIGYTSPSISTQSVGTKGKRLPRKKTKMVPTSKKSVATVPLNSVCKNKLLLDSPCSTAFKEKSNKHYPTKMSGIKITTADGFSRIKQFTKANRYAFGTQTCSDKRIGTRIGFSNQLGTQTDLAKHIVSSNIPSICQSYSTEQNKKDLRCFCKIIKSQLSNKMTDRACDTEDFKERGQIISCTCKQKTFENISKKTMDCCCGTETPPSKVDKKRESGISTQPVPTKASDCCAKCDCKRSPSKTMTSFLKRPSFLKKPSPNTEGTATDLEIKSKTTDKVTLPPEKHKTKQSSKLPTSRTSEETSKLTESATGPSKPLTIDTKSTQWDTSQPSANVQGTLETHSHIPPEKSPKSLEIASGPSDPLIVATKSMQSRPTENSAKAQTTPRFSADVQTTPKTQSHASKHQSKLNEKTTGPSDPLIVVTKSMQSRPTENSAKAQTTPRFSADVQTTPKTQSHASKHQSKLFEKATGPSDPLIVVTKSMQSKPTEHSAKAQTTPRYSTRVQTTPKTHSYASKKQTKLLETSSGPSDPLITATKSIQLKTPPAPSNVQITPQSSADVQRPTQIQSRASKNQSKSAEIASGPSLPIVSATKSIQAETSQPPTTIQTTSQVQPYAITAQSKSSDRASGLSAPLIIDTKSVQSKTSQLSAKVQTNSQKQFPTPKKQSTSFKIKSEPSIPPLLDKESKQLLTSKIAMQPIPDCPCEEVYVPRKSTAEYPGQQIKSSLKPPSKFGTSFDRGRGLQPNTTEKTGTSILKEQRPALGVKFDQSRRTTDMGGTCTDESGIEECLPRQQSSKVCISPDCFCKKYKPQPIFEIGADCPCDVQMYLPVPSNLFQRQPVKVGVTSDRASQYIPIAPNYHTLGKQDPTYNAPDRYSKYIPIVTDCHTLRKQAPSSVIATNRGNQYTEIVNNNLQKQAPKFHIATDRASQYAEIDNNIYSLQNRTPASHVTRESASQYVQINNNTNLLQKQTPTPHLTTDTASQYAQIDNTYSLQREALTSYITEDRANQYEFDNNTYVFENRDSQYTQIDNNKYIFKDKVPAPVIMTDGASQYENINSNAQTIIQKQVPDPYLMMDRDSHYSQIDSDTATIRKQVLAPHLMMDGSSQYARIDNITLTLRNQPHIDAKTDKATQYARINRRTFSSQKQTPSPRISANRGSQYKRIVNKIHKSQKQAPTSNVKQYKRRSVDSQKLQMQEKSSESSSESSDCECQSNLEEQTSSMSNYHLKLSNRTGKKSSLKISVPYKGSKTDNSSRAPGQSQSKMLRFTHKTSCTKSSQSQSPMPQKQSSSKIASEPPPCTCNRRHIPHKSHIGHHHISGQNVKNRKSLSFKRAVRCVCRRESCLSSNQKRAIECVCRIKRDLSMSHDKSYSHRIRHTESRCCVSPSTVKTPMQTSTQPTETCMQEILTCQKDKGTYNKRTARCVCRREACLSSHHRRAIECVCQIKRQLSKGKESNKNRPRRHTGPCYYSDRSFSEICKYHLYHPVKTQHCNFPKNTTQTNFVSYEESSKSEKSKSRAKHPSSIQLPDFQSVSEKTFDHLRENILTDKKSRLHEPQPFVNQLSLSSKSCTCSHEFAQTTSKSYQNFDCHACSIDEKTTDKSLTNFAYMSSASEKTTNKSLTNFTCGLSSVSEKTINKSPPNVACAMLPASENATNKSHTNITCTSASEKIKKQSHTNFDVCIESRDTASKKCHKSKKSCRLMYKLFRRKTNKQPKISVPSNIFSSHSKCSCSSSKLKSTHDDIAHKSHEYFPQQNINRQSKPIPDQSFSDKYPVEQKYSASQLPANNSSLRCHKPTVLDKSHLSLFRQNQVSNIAHRLSFPIYSGQSRICYPVLKTSSMRSSNKTCLYTRKPVLAKSKSRQPVRELSGQSKTSQSTYYPSYSNSSKLSPSISSHLTSQSLIGKFYPKLSGPSTRNQSKSSLHTSIVMTISPRYNFSDEEYSAISNARLRDSLKMKPKSPNSKKRTRLSSTLYQLQTIPSDTTQRYILPQSPKQRPCPKIFNHGLINTRPNHSPSVKMRFQNEQMSPDYLRKVTTEIEGQPLFSKNSNKLSSPPSTDRRFIEPDPMTNSRKISTGTNWRPYLKHILSPDSKTRPATNKQRLVSNPMAYHKHRTRNKEHSQYLEDLSIHRPETTKYSRHFGSHPTTITDRQRFESDPMHYHSRKDIMGIKEQPQYSRHFSSQRPEMSKYSRQFNSQPTPLTDRQCLESDGPMSYHPRKMMIRTKEQSENCPSQRPDMPKYSRQFSSQPPPSTDRQYFESNPTSFDPRKLPIGSKEQPKFSENLQSQNLFFKSHQLRSPPILSNERQHLEFDSVSYHPRKLMTQTETSHQFSENHQCPELCRYPGQPTPLTDKQRFESDSMPYYPRKITTGTDWRPKYSDQQPEKPKFPRQFSSQPTAPIDKQQFQSDPQSYYPRQLDQETERQPQFLSKPCPEICKFSNPSFSQSNPSTNTAQLESVPVSYHPRKISTGTNWRTQYSEHFPNLESHLYSRQFRSQPKPLTAKSLASDPMSMPDHINKITRANQRQSEDQSRIPSSQMPNYRDPLRSQSKFSTNRQYFDIDPVSYRSHKISKEVNWQPNYSKHLPSENSEMFKYSGQLSFHATSPKDKQRLQANSKSYNSRIMMTETEEQTQLSEHLPIQQPGMDEYFRQINSPAITSTDRYRYFESYPISHAPRKISTGTNWRADNPRLLRSRVSNQITSQEQKTSKLTSLLNKIHLRKGEEDKWTKQHKLSKGKKCVCVNRRDPPKTQNIIKPLPKRKIAVWRPNEIYKPQLPLEPFELIPVIPGRCTCAEKRRLLQHCCKPPVNDNLKYLNIHRQPEIPKQSSRFQPKTPAYKQDFHTESADLSDQPEISTYSHNLSSLQTPSTDSHSRNINTKTEDKIQFSEHLPSQQPKMSKYSRHFSSQPTPSTDRQSQSIEGVGESDPFPTAQSEMFQSSPRLSSQPTPAIDRQSQSIEGVGESDPFPTAQSEMFQSSPRLSSQPTPAIDRQSRNSESKSHHTRKITTKVDLPSENEPEMPKYSRHISSKPIQTADEERFSSVPNLQPKPSERHSLHSTRPYRFLHKPSCPKICKYPDLISSQPKHTPSTDKQRLDSDPKPCQPCNRREKRTEFPEDFTCPAPSPVSYDPLKVTRGTERQSQFSGDYPCPKVRTDGHKICQRNNPCPKVRIEGQKICRRNNICSKVKTKGQTQFPMDPPRLQVRTERQTQFSGDRTYIKIGTERQTQFPGDPPCTSIRTEKQVQFPGDPPCPYPTSSQPEPLTDKQRSEFHSPIHHDMMTGTERQSQLLVGLPFSTVPSQQPEKSNFSCQFKSQPTGSIANKEWVQCIPISQPNISKRRSLHTLESIPIIPGKCLSKTENSISENGPEHSSPSTLLAEKQHLLSNPISHHSHTITQRIDEKPELPQHNQSQQSNIFQYLRHFSYKSAARMNQNNHKTCLKTRIDSQANISHVLHEQSEILRNSPFLFKSRANRTMSRLGAKSVKKLGWLTSIYPHKTDHIGKYFPGLSQHIRMQRFGAPQTPPSSLQLKVTTVVYPSGCDNTMRYPGLLQQRSSRQMSAVRKHSAKYREQQRYIAQPAVPQSPYPDFNRVSMRYPGVISGPNQTHRNSATRQTGKYPETRQTGQYPETKQTGQYPTSPSNCKQCENNPNHETKQTGQYPATPPNCELCQGIPYPANYYYQPPAVGVSPPPNYARYPCFINPANKCGPKTCSDELALRAAYKRRPLLCITPEQTTKTVEQKKVEKKEQQEIAVRKKAKKARDKKKLRKILGKQNFIERFIDEINEAEKEAWPADVTCHPMYIHSLKHKPCFWIYECWPAIYPYFLNLYKCQEKLCQLSIYCLTICFWSPLLCCIYCCYGVFFK